jgi:hypothetical protein
MNKTIPTLVAVSALALGLAACTPEQRMSSKHPGSYESTETSTDARGTKTTKKSTVEVSVDEYGNKKEVITSKTTRDPEGLMNKTSTKTKHTTEQK